MIKGWMKPVIAIAVVLGLFFGAGFRIAHPVSGLSSALGTAKSSLAIYKSEGQSAVDSKVVVNVEGVGPAIGIVKSAARGNVDVDLGATGVMLVPVVSVAIDTLVKWMKNNAKKEENV